MVVTGDPTVYPCGRGFLPGTQGPGGGGSEPPLSPVIVTPSPPDPPDPPFIPSQPKPIPTPTGPGPGFPAPAGPAPPPPPADPGGGAGGPSRGPITGGPVRGPTAPPPTIPGVPAPLPAAQGPQTGGFYKCQADSVSVCPGQQNLPLNQATITGVVQSCVPCSPNFVSSNGVVVTDPACVYTTINQCLSSCPTFASTNLPCPPQTTGGQGQGPTTGLPSEPSLIRPLTSRDPIEPAPSIQVSQPATPSLSVKADSESKKITENQQAMNARVITAEELVQEEDFRDINRSIVQPTLFDPDFNFFKSESEEGTELVPNNYNSKALNREITLDIAELLSNREGTDSWRESTLQNLSDENILRSLSPRLVNAFEYIRHVGGRPVGVSTFLNVVRKHILEGTLDEFDVDYYIQIAESQFSDKFDVLQKPNEQEYADRLAISYLINNLYTFQNNKSSNWRNFQINRMRPLNEDLNMGVNVTTLDGTLKELSVPNEGFQVDKITALDQITVPSIGAPDKLNIGNGGGYYIDATDLNSQGVAVQTNNIITDAYYAPAPVRVKVLEMLDIDPAIKISASSAENKHEFVVVDSGADSIQPLFFAINLSSVVGDYFSDSLVENYSATYSRLTASSDIQVHMNNNALNTVMLCVDYRDPLYRYILDTSSFVASLNDFTMKGFNDNGFSGIGSRFVRNIPFSFVVSPVAGGKYNPFNGSSKLVSYGDTHVRTLSVLPAPDATIDSKPAPMFRAYSLKLQDGVGRVGIGESADDQNIGYQYSELDFIDTFYSASASTYTSGSTPLSAYGTAYMLREVVDYLSSTYNATSITWYDVFSRMPITRLGEMFYDSSKELILDIANGLRGGIQIENIENGSDNSSRIIAEDSKTIVTTQDRKNVTKFNI